MKRWAVVLLALSALAAGCRRGAGEAGPGGEPGKARTDLEGTWVVVSSEVEGRPAPAGDGGYTRMTFSGEDATLEGPAHKHDLRFSTDAAKRPRQINLYSKEEKVLWKGIYQVEGATLRLSYGLPNGERPTNIESTRGAKAILYVLKRATP